MIKKKYKFCNEELRYVEVKTDFKSKFIKALSIFFFGCLIGVVVYIFTDIFSTTPTERVLQNENAELLDNYLILQDKQDKTDLLLQELSQRDDSIYRSIFGVQAIPYEVREAGIGGHEPIPKIDAETYGEVVASVNSRLDRLQSKLNVQDESFKELLLLSNMRKEQMLRLPAIMPISNQDLTRTGSGFGMRLHPILRIRRMHEGIDFIAETGTEVYATAKGTVVNKRYSTTFGKVIEIDHGYGLRTLYAHLHDYNVKKGDVVNRGQVIGYVGNTGLSSGTHLHYEVHLNGKEVDPVHYFFNDLTPDQYLQIIEIASKQQVSLD